MSSRISNYYNDDFIRHRIKQGNHRGAIGGLWEQMGQQQFDYMCAAGLQPDHRLLDLGCGCLRGGLHFIAYLQAGHYYGIDLSQELMDTGYDIELGKAGLQQKMPRSNLACTDGFDASGFGVAFDYVLAQSVFTHLTLNHLRLSLIRLQSVTTVGAQFFATVFTAPDTETWGAPLLHNPGGITTHPDRDPYHYCETDIAYATHKLPWKLRQVENWDHPRNQKMAVFERL